MPDIDPFDPQPIAIRVTVQCGHCGSERSVLVPLVICYPQLEL
jgi:hypothetical protein